ncbi:MAG: hypothetical protein VB835_04875 [Pirellulales bacterium]
MERPCANKKGQPRVVGEIEALIGGQWVPCPEGKNIRHSAVAAWVERHHCTEEDAMKVERRLKNKTKDSN